MVTLHVWTLLPAALFAAGVVAFACAEPPGPGWWDVPDVPRLGVALVCWVAAVAAVAGHYM